MKSIFTLLTVAGILCAAPALVNAESGHSHDRVGGPKGGRFLEGIEPRAEFFVEKDRTVTVTFYDNALKPVAASEQAVTVIVETKGNRSTVEFEKKGGVLVSQELLPEGHALNLVVQFKQTVNAKPRNFRFVYEDHVCGQCKRAEYACICGH